MTLNVGPINVRVEGKVDRRAAQQTGRELSREFEAAVDGRLRSTLLAMGRG
jgi:hypothetical protein